MRNQRKGSHLKVEFSLYSYFILTFTYTLALMLCVALFIVVTAVVAVNESCV